MGKLLTINILDRIDKKIKVVVVDNFYDTLNSKWVQNFFGVLADFKIKSYQKEYPYGVLPFSGHDLVGIHLLLCEEENGEIKPLMGYKLITYNQCKKFYLDFPPIP